MKIYLALTLLLINSILSIEKHDFDLINGVIYRFDPFQKDEVYKFYIKANFAQNVTIAFHNDMITESPFSYISIYEYSNRDDTIENNKKSLSMVNVKGGYTDSVTFASYIVNSPNTNYIAFETSPKRQINPVMRIEVIDGVYDLSNRQTKTINNIKSGGIYIFYVPAKEEQKVNITLTTNYINSNPFNKLEISEYLLRENNFNAKTTKNQSISSTTITSNNKLISSFSYTVLPDRFVSYYHNYNVANYIALKVVPSNITYLTVQFNVLVSFHNLNNGDITLTNLKADSTYSFYMNIDKSQSSNLILEINNMNEKPFNYINIYEYADDSYAYEEKENQTILFSSKDNNLIYSFSYLPKCKIRQIKYIYINIKPLFDIKSLKIKKDIIGGSVELSTKDTNSIIYLKIGGPYFFLIKAEYFQKITFNVVIDHLDTIPFEIGVFNEYDYRGFKGSTTPEVTSQEKISFSSSNNQLISTFSYIVKKFWTRETAFKIVPNENIDCMHIKITLENTYYDFHFKQQTIYNLTVGNKYYLHKHTYGQGYNKLYLDLMMDYIDGNPVEPIKVYEYEWTFENDNKNESIISYLDIKTKIKDGFLYISSSYKINKERSLGVVFELSPKYNISSLKVNYEGNYDYFDNDGSFLGLSIYIYIPIVLAIIIIVILVVYIIKRCRAKARNLDYSSINQNQNQFLPTEYTPY